MGWINRINQITKTVKSKNLAFFVEAYLIVGSLTKIHPHIHTLTDADNHGFNHLFHLDIKTVQLIQLIQPQQIHGFHFYVICDTVIPVGRPGQFLCLTFQQPWPHRSMVQSSSRIKATSWRRVSISVVVSFFHSICCCMFLCVCLDYVVWILRISFLWHFPLISHIISWYLMISCISCGFLFHSFFESDNSSLGVSKIQQT